nr:hypothetical protein [Tanacetum cinerariifolium]GFA76762.1 hypothetical protein [Tanacetum cinerariifolium]GFB17153.1 hypothetical protein [Tanacetum cinerariifolium]
PSWSKVLLLLRVIKEEVGDELETSMEDVEGVCGAAAFMEKKEEMWKF